MGLEDVLEDIQKRKEETTDGLTKEAEGRIGEIVQNAKAEASNILKGMEEKSKEEAEQLLTRELSRANIEGKAIMNNALNERVEAGIKTILESIEEYRKSDSYRKLLSSFSRRAVSELGPETTIYSRREDMDYLRKTYPKYNIAESVRNIRGGIIAVSRDGRRDVDYSIENIIESKKDEIANEILKRIKVVE